LDLAFHNQIKPSIKMCVVGLPMIQNNFNKLKDMLAEYMRCCSFKPL